MVLQPGGEDVLLQGVVLLQEGLVIHPEGERVLLLWVEVVLLVRVAQREVILLILVDFVLLLRGKVIRPV